MVSVNERKCGKKLCLLSMLTFDVKNTLFKSIFRQSAAVLASFAYVFFPTDTIYPSLLAQENFQIDS